MPTAEEYEKEIAELRAELDRLKSGVNSLMTLGGSSSIARDEHSFTIQGLDEMILVVDGDGAITYLNDRMAVLLGIPPAERGRVMGSALSELKGDALAEVMASIYGAVKASGESYLAEREFPDLGPDRLPSLAARSVKDTPLLRFACSAVREKVQIVAQDVTHTNWLYKNFSRFVSPRVIEQMQTIPEDQLMRTEKREASILFADLSGFTATCQELPPEAVVEMVNSFLQNAVAAVDRFEGMVDKFIGDEIMAVFGAPLFFPDHALRALMAASLIIRNHREWMKERLSRGLPAPDVHIGVATGEVIIGNIGTSQRVDYTVLGHTVNLAARLCGKAAGGQVFTVHSTYAAAREGLEHYSGPEAVPKFRFEVVDEMALKNIKQPVKIISVDAKEVA